MFCVVITEKGGEQRRLEFDKAEVNIGRVQGNDVILPKGNVSKRHARIILKDGQFAIHDLNSTNGTYVNGRRISNPLALQDNDKVYIGDFMLNVEGVDRLDEARPVAPPQVSEKRGPPPPPSKRPARPTTPSDARSPEGAPGEGAIQSSSSRAPTGQAVPLPPRTLAEPASDVSSPGAPREASPSGEVRVRRPSSSMVPARVQMTVPEAAPARAGESQSVQSRAVREEILARLEEQVDLAGAGPGFDGRGPLRESAENALCDLLEAFEGEGRISTHVDRERLLHDLVKEAVDFGPLPELLADPTVSQILVNGTDPLFVERNGELRRQDACFSTEGALVRVIDRLVAAAGGAGRDPRCSLIEVLLKDGHRLQALLPPVAAHGPFLAIRKASLRMNRAEDLVDHGWLSGAVCEFLEACVLARQNIVISGGPGGGKTTVLGMIGNLVSHSERVVTIEQIRELQLDLPHWIPMVASPLGGDRSGSDAVPDLVRHAQRMRADRILLGVGTGEEVAALLEAIAAGAEGSLVAIHANGPAQALGRIETMVSLAHPTLPAQTVRQWIASTIDIVVHVSRFGDGSRRVTQVSEVVGIGEQGIRFEDIFLFRREGGDPGGTVHGRYEATGIVPTFYGDLKANGEPVNLEIFRR